MFRFDSFKKTATVNNVDNSNDPLHNQQQDTTQSFLQRITNADTILGVNKQRPTLSKSTSSANMSSFSIPMPTNSWGMLALARLQDEQDGELDDVVHLLLNKDKVSSCFLGYFYLQK